MSFDFHSDLEVYFDTQRQVTDQFIIPFILSSGISKRLDDLRVLEVGCGEAGVIKAFVDRGSKAVGIELSEYRTESAKKFLEQEINKGQVSIYNSDIYDSEIRELIGADFDVIILKDVIEHLSDHDKMVLLLRSLLANNGLIFIAFPPWQMPFGGHQQMCRNKYLSKTPYIHLLPKSLYRSILTYFNESEGAVSELIELTETGLSIESFESLVKNNDLHITNKKHFLFNPIYKWKFGLNPKEQYKFISAIPYFRNILTTGVYYALKAKF